MIPAAMRQDRAKVSQIVVDDEFSGQRLDNFLLRELKGVPRSLIYRIVRRGEVRVNDGRVRAHARLQGGDRIRIPPLRRSAEPAARRPRTPEAGFRTLYEDDWILVIDKPAGVAVHAGSGVPAGVIERLRADRPELRFVDLVHRLDRDTSGCLVLAKRRSSLRALHEDLRENIRDQRRFVKKYLALVHGEWPAQDETVEAPLRKNTPRSGERMVVVAEDGMYAKTRFDRLRELPGCTLVEASPVTGRTHQVRVHAAWAGHPIAGDEKYGDRTANARYRKLGLRRLFLHASLVRFTHPVRGHPVEVTCPLPEDLEQVLGRAAEELAGPAREAMASQRTTIKGTADRSSDDG